MRYKWKRAPVRGVKADVVGKEIERLENEYDGVTPEVLVDEARKKRSPLHACFEWDDRKAAGKYRLDQARYILREIEVVIEREDAEPLVIRAFHHVETVEQGKYYTTVSKAYENELLWQQVKAQAISEIKSWQKKYQTITEFEVVFDAIAKLV